jgi:hypothetical protein
MYESVYEMGDALIKSGVAISDVAADALQGVQISTECRKLNLAKLAGRGLGFVRRASASEIFTRAALYGLALVPPEVGPQLRLQYIDQPAGERVILAMEAISCDGYPHIFALTSPGGSPRLEGEYGSHGHFWMPSDIWIFSLPG